MTLGDVIATANAVRKALPLLERLLSLAETIAKNGKDPMVELVKIEGRYRDVEPEAESRWEADMKKRFGDG